MPASRTKKVSNIIGLERMKGFPFQKCRDHVAICALPAKRCERLAKTSQRGWSNGTQEVQMLARAALERLRFCSGHWVHSPDCVDSSSSFRLPRLTSNYITSRSSLCVDVLVDLATVAPERFAHLPDSASCSCRSLLELWVALAE